MQLLLTSDLHRDKTRLRWLAQKAPPHDALLVAGDLLNIFSDTGFTEQKSGALLWRQSVLDSGKSFAWCSGNHDFFYAENTAMSSASPLWMRESPSSPNCVTDGETRLLRVGRECVAITTVPWPVHAGIYFSNAHRTNYTDFVKGLLCEGRNIQAQNNIPWIVLCHEPPGRTPLSATYVAPEADFARRMIEEAEPDFSLHGHVHQAPVVPGGSWIWRLGKTVCFNAGQSLAGEPPYFIQFELRSVGNWTAHWHGSGQIRRAEAGTFSANGDESLKSMEEEIQREAQEGLATDIYIRKVDLMQTLIARNQAKVQVFIDAEEAEAHPNGVKIEELRFEIERIEDMRKRFKSDQIDETLEELKNYNPQFN